MNEHPTELTTHDRPELSTSKPTLGGWLVDPSPRRFFLPITGAWILGLDWLLFSQDLLTLGLAIPILAVVGFFVGGGGTYFLQRRFGRDNMLPAIAKSLLAGVAVGVPWPIIGSVVGGWILLASGLTTRTRNAAADETTSKKR